MTLYNNYYLAVHELSPYDVAVVGALGDSVTVSPHGRFYNDIIYYYINAWVVVNVVQLLIGSHGCWSRFHVH